MGTDYHRTCEMVREKKESLLPEGMELLYMGSEVQSEKVDNSSLDALRKAAAVHWMSLCDHTAGQKEPRMRSCALYMTDMDLLFKDEPENAAYLNMKTMVISESYLRQPFTDAIMFDMFKSGKAA